MKKQLLPRSGKPAADAERARQYKDVFRFIAGGTKPASGHIAERTVATADAILRASKTRDSGGKPLPPPTGEAAQILAAGRKRRGETT